MNRLSQAACIPLAASSLQLSATDGIVCCTLLAYPAPAACISMRAQPTILLQDLHAACTCKALHLEPARAPTCQGGTQGLLRGEHCPGAVFRLCGVSGVGQHVLAQGGLCMSAGKGLCGARLDCNVLQDRLLRLPDCSTPQGCACACAVLACCLRSAARAGCSADLAVCCFLEGRPLPSNASLSHRPPCGPVQQKPGLAIMLSTAAARGASRSLDMSNTP